MRIQTSWRMLLILLIVGCAAQKGVDLDQPKRASGRENDIKIDAQLFNDRLSSNSLVSIRYDIENLSGQPIAIADVLPESEYEKGTRTITVNIGAEVPGNEILPRLLRINPGERRNFSVGARMMALAPMTGPGTSPPKYLRLKLNYLAPIAPFKELIDIPERAIKSSKMADELFLKWVESNQAVATNSIPVEWVSRSYATIDDRDPGRMRGGRRRRPGSPF